MKTINSKLLEILVCPITKQTLRYDQNHHELISNAAYLAFPIKNNIPVITVESARKISSKELFKDSVES